MSHIEGDGMRLLGSLLLLAAAMHLGAQEKWTFGFENRVRYETRTATGFGKAPDIGTGLMRTRVSLAYQPLSWIKFSGMLQDTRAPWYGDNAPNTVRDPVDLHESYVEIRPGTKTGFTMSVGRRMLNYGEGRLLGTPQWGNNSRTYDHARVAYKFARAQFEFLVVSPVKIRIGEFNRPVLSERIWGTYSVFPEIFGKSALEAYALRRDPTTGLASNTFGGRLFGPVNPATSYNLEAAFQNGKAHQASAFAGWIKKRFTVADRSLQITGEYKYASPTFDQLYAANHDWFGHQDLFAWRNVHAFRNLNTYAVTKSFSVNFMFDSFWLAMPGGGLYNGSGKLMVSSIAPAAGRHVGEEADLFATYRRSHLLLGAGYGHLCTGQFVRLNTPGVGPTYLYLFHTFSL
jgi:alginate export protein